MRVRGVLAAAGLVAGMVVAGVQPAGAATSWSCSFAVPHKLVLSGPNTFVAFRLGGNCPGPTQMKYATWTGNSSGLPAGPYEVGCDLDCSVEVNVTGLGATETWKPSGPAVDWKDHVMPVKLLPGYSLTKTKSVTQLSAVRRATKVTLTASATYYSPKLHVEKYVRSHGRMLLMYQDPGKPWQTLTYVTPNSSGLATYTITTNRARKYQAYLPSTATTWYSYSPAVTR